MTNNTVFVTVGTTSFDALVRVIDSDACLEALLRRGFRRVVIQLGTGTHVPARDAYAGEGAGGGRIAIEHFRHSPSLAQHIADAGLVISHGGAGTIMEVLRARTPLVAVINGKLMGNHQAELGGELAARGHLICTTPKKLVSALQSADDLASLLPWPDADEDAFGRLCDEEMGFAGAPARPHDE